jgi:hypothetical protein
VDKAHDSQGISADMEQRISMKTTHGGPSQMERSLEALSDVKHACVSTQTVNSIGTQTDEYVDDIVCQTCGSVGVLHACGHWQCTTLTCRPTWYQRLEARKWLIPQSPVRILDKQLFQTRQRCVDCRPEGRCLKGACPRYCNFVFRRGTCKFGATCSFCHLHGRADASGKFKGEVDSAAEITRAPSSSHLPPRRPQWFPTLGKPEYQGSSDTSRGMNTTPRDSLRGCCNADKQTLEAGMVFRARAGCCTLTERAS